MITKTKRNNIFFLMLICVYIFCIFFVIPLIPAKLLKGNFSAVIVEIIILVPTLVYIFLTNGEAVKNIGHRFVHIWDIALLIILTYLLIPFVGFINAVTMLFAKNYVAEEMDSLSKNPLWLNLVLVALIPALVEELIFRGVIYSGYKKSKMKYAILANAFIFGMFHMNVNQFAYAFFMAIIFAVIYEATGSIFSTMLVHFIFNGNSVVLSYLADLSGEETNAETISFTELSTPSKVFMIYGYFFMAAITLTIAYFVLRRIAKNNHRWKHLCALAGTVIGKKYIVNKTDEKDYVEADTEHNNEKIIDIIFVIASILCVAMMVFLVI